MEGTKCPQGDGGDFNMTNEEKAYLAGIIDGEGCISIYSKERNGPRRFGLRLTIYNSDLQLMDWITKRLGGKAVECITHRQQGRLRNYQWATEGHRAIKVLSQVYPYMVMKRKQAGIAFEFGKTLQQAHETCRLAENIKIQRKILYSNMGVANQRPEERL